MHGQSILITWSIKTGAYCRNLHIKDLEVKHPKYFFKILGPHREPVHGGSGRWPIPGKWTKDKLPMICKSGYHMCAGSQLARWLNPDAWLSGRRVLWIAERGPILDVNFSPKGKVCTDTARLIMPILPTKNSGSIFRKALRYRAHFDWSYLCLETRIRTWRSLLTDAGVRLFKWHYLHKNHPIFYCCR